MGLSSERSQKSEIRMSVGAGVLALSGLLMVGVVDAAADTINMQGSTTVNTRLIEPYKQLIEAGSGHSLTVVANKSVNGLVALLERRTDLAMLSSSLEEELDALKKQRNDLPYHLLRKFELFNSRIAFAVNPGNPVRAVSIENVGLILAGTISNWKQIGGPDLGIRPVYVRSAGGVTNSVITQMLGGKPIAAADPITVETGLQVVKVVAQEPRALGLAQIRLAQLYKLPELDTAGHFVEQTLSIISLGEPNAATLAVITVARAVAEKKLAEAN